MRRGTLILTWAMLPVAAGLVLLLVTSVAAWRENEMGEAGVPGGETGVAVSPAAEQTRQYFGWPDSVKWTPLTNASNPFFTLAIQPPPPPKPPAPPPATRKLDVTYRGFFETSAGVRRAVVQVADKEILALRGDRVLADYVAVEIELRHLALTNAAGTPVKLEFARTQQVEVPAK